MSNRWWIGVGLAIGLAACGGSGTPSGQPAPARSTDAWLRVDNQTFTDLNMFVWHNNSRQRLGRSTANTSVTFRIPPDVLTSNRARVRFSADPIGRVQESLTRELEVAPGDTVIMIIPPF